MDAASMTTPDTTPPAVPAKSAAVSAPAPDPVAAGTQSAEEKLVVEAAGTSEYVLMADSESEPEKAAATDGDVVYEQAFTKPLDDEEKPADDEPEKWVHPEGWKYDWVTFKGDELAIKIPSKGMINAIAHAGTTSLEFQTKLVHDFETTHISQPSRERVITRLMDPEDPEYTGDEWDELQSEVLKLGAERVQKDAEELAKVKG